jgi:hypothetical protein
MMPWRAASDAEFYSGAKMALAIGLLANVLTQLVMMRWASRPSASRRDAQPSGEGPHEKPEHRH